MLPTAERGAATPTTPLAGVCVGGGETHDAVLDLLRAHGLADRVDVAAEADGWRFTLQQRWADAWVPGHDTLQLAQTLGLATPADGTDLARETLIALLASPLACSFASTDELVSAVRMRVHIAQAASRTALAFDTAAAERPEADWRYDPQRGFVLRPGRDLIAALVRATQPAAGDPLYAFSCYRATEYVMLLGIALELRDSHPALLARLQQHCQHEAIRSGRFHDVFLHEVGSTEQPLPPRYYVPGDRLWFRNPDERSADVTGFEGSWVIYLGAGLFSNFWQRDRPFTLAAKALEIYHWRHGAAPDAQGDLTMDESVVAKRVAATMAEPAEVARILALMVRPREPKGVYVAGGCIDTTRESPRHVRPGTADIRLPPLD